VTAPNQSAPDGAYVIGTVDDVEDWDEASVRAVTKAPVLDKFGQAQTNLHATKPSFNQTPIDMSMWATMNPKEHCSIPRSQLINGTASDTGSTDGNGQHRHQLNSTPQYRPDGNEGEVAFIRLQRDAKIRYVGFATGTDGLFGSNMNRAHIGVYSVNQDTGTATLLTPSLAAADIKAQVNQNLKEFVFDIGSTIDGKQNEIYAVIMAQITGAFQTPQTYIGVRVKKTDRWNGDKYPLYQYAWCDLAAGNTMPSTLPNANIHYNNDPMTIPFFFLREE